MKNLKLYISILFILASSLLLLAFLLDSPHDSFSHMLVYLAVLLFVQCTEIIIILISESSSVKEIKNHISPHTSKIYILCATPFSFVFGLGDKTASSSTPGSSDPNSENFDRSKERILRKYTGLEAGYALYKKNLDNVEKQEESKNYPDDFVSPARARIAGAWYAWAQNNDIVDPDHERDLFREADPNNPSDKHSALLELLRGQPLYLESKKKAELASLSKKFESQNPNPDDSMDVD